MRCLFQPYTGFLELGIKFSVEALFLKGLPRPLITPKSLEFGTNMIVARGGCEVRHGTTAQGDKVARGGLQDAGSPVSLKSYVKPAEG